MMHGGRVSCFLEQRIAVKQLALHIDTWYILQEELVKNKLSKN